MNVMLQSEKNLVNGVYRKMPWEFQTDTLTLIVSQVDGSTGEVYDLSYTIKKDGGFTKASEKMLEADKMKGVPKDVLSGLRAMGMFKDSPEHWLADMAESGYDGHENDHRFLAKEWPKCSGSRPDARIEKQEITPEIVSEQEEEDKRMTENLPATQDQKEAQIPEVVNAEAWKLAEEIDGIIAQTEKNFIALSEKLWAIEKNGYYNDLGFNNTANLGQERFGLEYRALMHMLKIGQAKDVFNISDEKLLEIGYTKMTKISSEMLKHPEQAGLFLEMATGKTVKELDNELHSKDGKVTSDKIRFSLKYEAEAARTVSDAIATAKVQIGEEDLSKAILSICQDWMAYNQADGGVASLEDHIHVLEERYGVVLTVSEREEGEPLPLGEEGQEAETAGDDFGDI